MQRTLGGAALRSHELRDRHPDVAADLAEQGRRDIAAGVHRHGGDPAVGVAELLVRPALANLHEPKPLEAGRHLPRLEDRDGTHAARR